MGRCWGVFAGSDLKRKLSASEQLFPSDPEHWVVLSWRHPPLISWFLNPLNFNSFDRSSINLPPSKINQLLQINYYTPTINSLLNQLQIHHKFPIVVG